MSKVKQLQLPVSVEPEQLTLSYSNDPEFVVAVAALIATMILQAIQA